MSAPVQELTRKDFVSDQDVRWCPGCGDYAILGAVQNVLPKLGVPKENIVMVSGIGCSSRFPFYVNTFGFHTVHGRAPTVASGLRCANPDLDVWMITGDGDGFSIGGNHMMHLLRRNLRIKVLLFNNRIYGLTKGQYSPTSPPGLKTKSTPFGSIDTPVNPCSVALGSEASFVARSSDKSVKHLQGVLEAAHAHKGTAFVEILQNCVIFNDGTWDHVTGKEVRDDSQLLLEHGKPLRFGANKGIRMNAFEPEVVTLGENGVTEADLMVHDAHRTDPSYAFLLSRLGFQGRDTPLPMGVLRQVERPCYEDALTAETKAATDKAAAKGIGLADMYRGFGKVSTWDVG
ncbi:MAG: 2-oxoacid:ferredoxin oxidoreductase subunit beta [Planctomycetota bacterium]|jgi:2-oxoglutarate ferredoxin oxidoreductase subunit beta|nr:2-oxoacid:ferredoxin oxidoreductase subunit beta [Planctomycetota bacterium]